MLMMRRLFCFWVRIAFFRVRRNLCMCSFIKFSGDIFLKRMVTVFCSISCISCFTCTIISMGIWKRLLFIDIFRIYLSLFRFFRAMILLSWLFILNKFFCFDFRVKVSILYMFWFVVWIFLMILLGKSFFMVIMKIFRGMVVGLWVFFSMIFTRM